MDDFFGDYIVESWLVIYMDNFFGDYIVEGWLVIYMDNLLIHSSN